MDQQYRYLVVPFIGQIKTGLFSKENAQTVSAQLQALIEERGKTGWEFYSVEKIGIVVKPGCLAALLGAKESLITFDQVIFRRPRPERVEASA